MSTISATTHRTASMNLFIALAIVVVAALAFAVVPSIALPGSAVIPVTGSQNAYVDFLQGEKVMYAESVRLSEILPAYRLGEQAIYAGTVDSGYALTTWHLGEKAVVKLDALDSALLIWMQGEKGAK
jgi:hypothetical protein